MSIHMRTFPPKPERLRRDREHRRRRLRRHGRRAYIRSAYSLPSLATLGNAVCGFGSMYVASLHQANLAQATASNDPWTHFFEVHGFLVAAYLIFVAMFFDAIDGRLARFTRHTTDFGGQLDSLADVISFGAAPAFLVLQVFKAEHPFITPVVGRLFWAFGALYMCCAAMRLARFNVSNEHGEQHHFSFLGLPSPGAGGAVAAVVLMQQDLALTSAEWARADTNATLTRILETLNAACIWLLPFIVLGTGLLMVSGIRYPHLVNRYLRGRRSFGRIILMVVLLLAVAVAHRYVLGIASLAYALTGVLSWGYLRVRPRPATAPPASAVPATPVGADGHTT